jgi:hypothetical protein
MTPQPQQFNAENFAAILAGQLQPGVVESLITSDDTAQKTEKLIDFMEYEGRGAIPPILLLILAGLPGIPSRTNVRYSRE